MTCAKRTYLTLLVDDSTADLALIVRALRDHPEFLIVHKCLSGEQAIAYLKGAPPFDDRVVFPLPDLLICDLKMHVVDGFHVLEWLQANPFPQMVTVILTGSNDPADADNARALGADLVCIKPISLDYLREAADRLECFMLTNPKVSQLETPPSHVKG